MNNSSRSDYKKNLRKDWYLNMIINDSIKINETKSINLGDGKSAYQYGGKYYIKNGDTRKEISSDQYQKLLAKSNTTKASTKSNISKQIDQEFEDKISDIKNSKVSRRVDFISLYGKNDPRILDRFTDDESSEVRATVALYTEDPKIHAKLANDESSDVREAVAKKATDPKVLLKLSNDESYSVLVALVNNYNVRNNQKLLSKLADSKSQTMRKTAAAFTKDPKIHAKLANDDDPNVREVVIEHTEDPKLLYKLADDEDPNNRNKVLTQAGKLKDRKTLKKLTNDKNSDISDFAKYKLSKL